MRRIFVFPTLVGCCIFALSFSVEAKNFHQIKTAADLQSALTEAQSNGEDDVIKLTGKTYSASGGTFTYIPTENHSLTLTGANPNATTLDGGGTNQVLSIDTTALADDSNADVTVKNVTVQNGAGQVFGGGLGVMTLNADITVDNCVFSHNDVASGNSGGAGLLSFESGNISVTGSSFVENTATGSGGLRVNSDSGTITVTGNTLTGNKTSGLGGVGGLNVEPRHGGALVIGNILSNNESSAGAGGMAVTANGEGSVVLVNNAFSNNIGGAGQQGFGGGGVAIGLNGSGSMILTNNSFSGNSTAESGHGPGNGGGIYLKIEIDTTAAFLFNNIVFGNTADGNGNDIYVADDGNNSNHDNIGSPVEVSHNDFGVFYSFCQNTPACDPHVTQAANLNADPLFADAAGGDLHLTQGSPCIDAGDAAAPGLPATDFEGDPRIIGNAPDMGADEF